MLVSIHSFTIFYNCQYCYHLNLAIHLLYRNNTTGTGETMNAIYDTKEVKRLIKEAVRQSVKELSDTPRHMLDPSNPNHPDYDLHIFGYHCDDFLAKQYKPVDNC